MIYRRQSHFSVIFLSTFLYIFSQIKIANAQQSTQPPAEESLPTSAPTTPEATANEPENETAADPSKTDAPTPEGVAPKEPTTVETSKVDISDSSEVQDELYSQDKLPFRYLNQYYTYSVKDGVVNLNEKNFTLNNIILTVDSKRVLFKMKDEMLTYFKKGRVSIENESGEELAGTRFELKDDQFAVKRMPAGRVICFQIKSRYSTLKICKTLSSDTNQSIKSVKVGDSNLSDQGQIVVQDTSDRSEFKVEFTNEDIFYFETQRRKVYPATIRKKKDSEELLVRFVDLDVQTLAWEDKVQIDQRYFEIKMDPLIQIRQDILFPDPKGLKAQAFAKTLIQKKQVLLITKNKFTITPIISFSQLIGSDENLSVKMTTKMGLGLSSQYSRNFKNKWDWFTQAHFYSTTMFFEDETKTLLGKKQSLFQVSGGTIYHWKKNWDIELSLGARTDMFLKPVNVSEGVEVFNGLNKFLGFGFQWSLFKNKTFEFLMPATFRFTLPGTVGGVNVNLGSRHDLGFLTHLRLSWGRVFGGFYYGARQQNYTEFSFRENYANSYIGVIYLF